MSSERPPPQPDATTDEELWQAFVRGDDTALEKLAERYRDELFWYLLLSTGKQETAAQCVRNVWALLAAYRLPVEGFDSFRSWIYAVTTQNAVPAAHPEPFGLTELVDDMKRGKVKSRRARLFFCIRDMKRAVRQPFLLVTAAGLSLEDAARACNFTVARTVHGIEQACRHLTRAEPIGQPGHYDEL